MRAIWPTVTLRSIGELERTTVVVHSMSRDLPRQLVPIFPAYEERFLCLVLSLLRSPRSNVVYVTSEPILPRLVDYFFGLVPGFDTPEARGRLTIVSLVDGSDRPLTEKLLERPGAIERIRAASPQAGPGADRPVRHLRGRGRARGAARAAPLRRRPGARLAGNEARRATGVRGRRRGTPARVRRRQTDESWWRPSSGSGANGRAPTASSSSSTRGSAASATRSWTSTALTTPTRSSGGSRRSCLENPEQNRDEYFEALAEQGGIVEERIRGTEFRSPSAQLRLSPAGLVEVLSTHDQVLGGPQGQTYFGCRFPADPEYAERIGTRRRSSAGASRGRG